ncbi:MAG: hypothetical protein E7487_05560 [Ruminococcaceae bacterium]|nr:hypothetical protein [Oscillospiraceae bacterium]
MNQHLLVGVGREIVTPPIGGLLMGYSPPRASESVNDDIHITAFAFEYNGVRSLIASAELCSLRGIQIKDILEAVSESSGIPVGRIILSTVHTHSAPYTLVSPDERPNYIYDQFIPSARKAALDAVNSLRPAVMGVGTTQSDVGVNRRVLQEDGTITHGQDPTGIYDPTMTIISFREPDGTAIGNLIHYGAHNTASGINTEITRDWCGVAIDRLEELSGGVTAFFNGGGGDCGPRLPNGRTTGTLKEALELGGRAASDAVRAWRSITEWREVDMHVLTDNITLPLRPFPPLEEMEAKLAAMGDPSKLTGLRVSAHRNLIQRIEYIRSGAIPPTTFDILTPAIAVGPVVFLPIPFEPFSIIPLRIKQYSPYPYTVSIGYANGGYSYLPSMDQICRGGYEVWMFTSMNLVPFGDESEQYFVTGATRMIRELYQKTHGDSL